MKISILLFLLPIIGFSQNNTLDFAKDYLIKKEYIVPKEFLLVSVKNQILYHIRDNYIMNTYIISSAEKGTGNKSGSNKTPTGIHVIKKKIGSNVPINGKLIGRIFYGEISKIFRDTTRSKTDDITSRILWLDGQEEGINKGEGIDSYKRYIYIHGTSEEGRLGTPSSHGCIRMKNKEVINLYNQIEVGTLVLIF